MVESWMREVIMGWHREIEWTDDEIKHLEALLSSICELNNGIVYDDVRIPEKEIIKHKIERTNNVLDSYAANIIRHYFKQSLPVCRTESKEFSVDLPFIEPTEHTLRVNLNLAGQKELERLPGVGRETAARIISYRRAKGGIVRISELKKVKGISAKNIDNLAYKVYLSNPGSVAIHLPKSIDLVHNPSFKSYISFLKDNNVMVSKYCLNPENLGDLIIREIEGIAGNLEARPNQLKFSPGMRASKLKDRINKLDELHDFVKQQSDVDSYGVLLWDSRYYYFVLELLKSAQNRIRIIMFFFAFSEDKKHPSNRLMEEIIRAKDRGVDIKIILDHQDENDPKPSQIINKEAMEYLRDNDIPVTYDSEETATHTKLLLVDNEHVVVGSHNWTAGSYFVYQDASIYVHSKKLTDFYYSIFESLWKQYNTG